MKDFICGAWHSEIAKNWVMDHEENTRRIFAHNPDNETDEDFYPLGVDEKYVFDGKHMYDRFNFFTQFKQSCTLMVLSEKEKELLITSGISHCLKITIFERQYSFYKDIKFINNAHKNHKQLTYLIQYLFKRNMIRETTNYWSKKFSYKIARKLKNRSALDSGFAHASFLAYQEAFKLVEARSNRKIIAFDFNSMFGDCMSGEFADPSRLTHHKINKFYSKSNKLPCGLYRTRLNQPLNDFIKNYHALKYASLNKKFSFTPPDDRGIEILLHSNEIDFYANHFKEIFVYEGIYSSRVITHPLFSEARRTYAQRVNFKLQKNHMLERLCKLKLATMHSAVKRRKYEIKIFKKFIFASEFLRNNFGLTCPEEMNPRDFLKYISDGKRFKITVDEKITIRYLKHEDNSLVFSLYSQVIANARVKMMKTIENFLSFPGVDICYCNIDSLHVSLPQESVSDFLNYAAPLIGEKMGQLKVEVHADKGYWFEAGRYWLIKDNQVVMYKNQGLNNPYVKNFFQNGRSYYKIYKENGYTIPVKCRRDISGVLTYKKIIEFTQDTSHILFSRFNLSDITTINQIQLKTLDEINKSCDLKIELFNKISDIYQ